LLKAEKVKLIITERRNGQDMEDQDKIIKNMILKILNTQTM